MSNGFERRKEQSKEDIRKAAWELFGQFGVERVSVADIARKAGVSQATIYNNFGSKDALAREFVTGAVDHLVDRAREVLGPDMSYRAKMDAFVEFLGAILVHERPKQVDATIFTSSADLLQDPGIKRIRDTAQETMTNLLLGLVEEGKAQGQVDPALSTEALRIYFGAFMDVFTDPRLQGRFSTSDKIVQDLGSLMIDGLSGPPR
jgi:AcrR family transcriptional regulator